MAIDQKLFDFTTRTKDTFTAGDRLASLTQGPYEKVFVDVYDISEHPDNRAVDQNVVRRIAESIKEHGLGQLPLLRTHPKGNTTYEHIAGWHRILAFRLLYEETGDDRYAKIPAIVNDELSDEQAHMLVWATNLYTKTLTPEEEGKAYQIIGKTIIKDRETNPELAGVRTAQLIAQEVEELTGQSVSESTVKRRLKKAKESDSEPPIEVSEDNSPDTELEDARRALEALARAIERLENTPGVEYIPKASFAHYIKRLKKLGREVKLD